MLAKRLVNIYSRDSQQILKDDYLDLLHRIRKFHMSKYMYNAEVNIIDWYEALINKPYYYLKDKDSQLIDDFFQSNFINDFENCYLYEVGPGAEKTLISKTLPLIKALNPANYIAIDVSLTYANQASLLINNITTLPTDYIVCDAFFELPNFEPDKKVLLAIIGNTLGNLTDVELHNFLWSASHSMKKGDGLLLTLDSMMDQSQLMSAYDNNYTYQLMLNIMRNLKVVFNLEKFDTEAFKLLYRYNSNKSAVELALKATKRQKISFIDHNFVINKGDELDLVMSRKFSKEFLKSLALRYNFKITLTHTLFDNPMFLAILTKI